jgi:hypothetical protein
MCRRSNSSTAAFSSDVDGPSQAASTAGSTARTCSRPIGAAQVHDHQALDQVAQLANVAGKADRPARADARADSKGSTRHRRRVLPGDRAGGERR